jgi:Ribbon-helix-helix protein, copG family.
MKTAISIPDDLFEKAEELAERLEVSRSQLYARAIEEYTERHTSQRVREKLDEVYGDNESALDPVFAIMQSIALPPEKW